LDFLEISKVRVKTTESLPKLFGFNDLIGLKPHDKEETKLCNILSGKENYNFCCIPPL
jgi:hypothetical protein